MNKILLIIGSVALLTNCSQEPVKEPANVTSHTRVNKLLDNCQRLATVKSKYVIDKKLSQLDNKIKAQEKMKQKAYDKYRANNIVLLSSHVTKGGFREPDTITGRGIAYKCY